MDPTGDKEKIREAETSLCSKNSTDDIVAADSKADCKNIELQLLEIINGAFDECARAQADLRQKVNNGMMDIFKQHSPQSCPAAVCITGESHVSRMMPYTFPSVTPMPLPVIPQLSVHSSDAAYSSESWEPFDGCTHVLVESREMCRDGINATEDDTVDALPPRSSQSSHSTVMESMPPRSSKFSALNRTSRRSADSASDCFYLQLAGKFTRKQSFFEYPPWIRMIELLLSSDTALVSRLKPYWLSEVDGREVRKASSIVAASNKASFVLNVQKFNTHVLGSFKPRSQSSLALAAVEQTRRFTHGVLYLRHLIPAIPLHPSSGHRLVWDSVCIAICLYDMITLPMVAFDFDADTQAAKDTVDMCIAIFWTMDICLSFCTAYSDGHEIQRGLRQIARSYVRSWFLADLTIVINDWVAVFASQGSFGALRFAKLFKTLIRGVRLIRLYKMSAHYQMILQMMVSEVGLTIVKIGTQALSVAMVCHYMACGWYALHDISSTRKTWVNQYLTPSDSTAYRYTTSLHWALTQLLPASIQVQPVNMLERFYNIIIILISMVVFSSFISSITVNMNHLRAFRIASIERESQLRKFFSQYETSPEVIHSIWSFITKSTRSSNSSIKPEEVNAFKRLPEHILEPLYQDAFERHLSKHPLLDYLSRFEKRCMAKLCRTGLELRFLFNSEVLWHDLRVDKMLFVRCGTLSYEDLLVKQGDWCCEEALWAENPLISAPFSAGLTGCELIMLRPDAFQNVISTTIHNVNTLCFCARYGEEFTRSFNEACYDVDFKDITPLFNTKGIVVDIMKRVTRSFNVHEFGDIY